MTENLLVTHLLAGTSNANTVAFGTLRVATGLVGEQASMSLFPFPVRDPRLTTYDPPSRLGASTRSKPPAGQSARCQKRGSNQRLSTPWQLILERPGVGK